MSKRDGSKRRGLSQDERVLWSTVTRSIAPLRAGAQSRTSKPSLRWPKGRAGRRVTKAHRSAGARRLRPSPRRRRLTPLSRRMRRSVARGKEAIDARLDLHGLTQAQAHAALLRFLRRPARARHGWCW